MKLSWTEAEMQDIHDRLVKIENEMKARCRHYSNIPSIAADFAVAETNAWALRRILSGNYEFAQHEQSKMWDWVKKS